MQNGVYQPETCGNCYVSFAKITTMLRLLFTALVNGVPHKPDYHKYEITYEDWIASESEKCKLVLLKLPHCYRFGSYCSNAKYAICLKCIENFFSQHIISFSILISFIISKKNNEDDVDGQLELCGN